MFPEHLGTILGRNAYGETLGQLEAPTTLPLTTSDSVTAVSIASTSPA
jgi:hypothetical protein